MEDDPLKFLGLQVRRARIKAGYSSARAFAAAVGVSDKTILHLEAGQGPWSPRTLVLVEDALGWPEGTAETIMETGRRVDDLLSVERPAPVGPPDAVLAAIDASPRLNPETRAHLRNQYGMLVRMVGEDRAASAIWEAARAGYPEPHAPNTTPAQDGQS